MSRRFAATVLAVVFAGYGAYAAEQKSPHDVATQALTTGLKHLENKEFDAAQKDFSDAKQAYMHLFVHDRRASHVLMKAMKSWADQRRAKPSGIDGGAAAIIDAFTAWIRERDTLASAVVNLGHNSPDWK